MTHRGPFQPLPFCDSVCWIPIPKKNERDFGFRARELVKCPFLVPFGSSSVLLLPPPVSLDCECQELLQPRVALRTALPGGGCTALPRS